MSIQVLSCLPDQCWDTITMSIQVLSCLQTNAGTPSPCLYRPCPAFRPMLGHHHHVYTGPVLPSDQCWDTITMSIQALSCLQTNAGTPSPCLYRSCPAFRPMLGHHHHVYTGPVLPSDQCWDTITMSIQVLSCLQTNAGTPSPCLYRSCSAFQTNAGTPSPCLYRSCSAFQAFLGDRPTTYHPTHTLTTRWPLQEANTGRY
ncbi:hypothetical protein ACOMHN_062295 [Nucella lapillus]